MTGQLIHLEQTRHRHSRTLNLFPLQAVLLLAVNDAAMDISVPDPDEQLAFELIRRMRAEHKLANPFNGLVVEPALRIQGTMVPETVGRHA